MSSKSKLNLNKSTLSETPTPNGKVSKVAPNDKVSSVTPITKVSPATPKVAKLSRGVVKSDNGSASPLPSSRVSVDRSPGSVTSKPVVDRRSPKLSTTPDKQPTRLPKGSELQFQLNVVQEDLKKAKEKLAEVEKEKTQALDELKEAQRFAEEANEKLTTALVAQKRAEEESEIEKFHALEMEQVDIGASQKKKEEQDKEIEDLRNQHSVDISALLSTTHELEKVKQELAMTFDAKNQALCHADEATKIAEIHAEKVEIMSAELVRLRAAFESMNESEVNSNNVASNLKSEVQTLVEELEKAKEYENEARKYKIMVMELESEIETLKHELQKGNGYVQKLAENEAAVEQLSIELEAAKIAEACASAKARDYGMEAAKNSEIEMELKSEVDTLTQKLDKAKDYEQQILVANELTLEHFKAELEAAKMAESHAHYLVEERQKRVEELELHSEQANQLERSALESLNTIKKQLEESNDLLHDAESEVSSLKEKLGSLELSIGSQRIDLEESERRVDIANKQASDLAKEVESLKFMLDTVKDEKTQALKNEKLSATTVEAMLEEKNKLIIELDTSREEEEKSKKAMESLASALHEVSSEARQMKEKLLSSQDEHENLKTQVENLELELRASNEKYEGMLDDARCEIDVLNQELEQSKHDQQTVKANWEQKELHLMDSVNKSEEENTSLTEEVSRLVSLLKDAESEACAAKKEEAQVKDSLAEAEHEVDYLKKILGETKAESMRLKESLLDKENELQSIIQENEELQSKEFTSLKKVDEFSKLLEEAMTRERAEENAELTDSEKDYDMLPKVVEFSEQNGNGKIENSKSELPHQNFQVLVQEIPLEDSNAVYVKGVDAVSKSKDLNGKPNWNENKEKEDDKVEVEFKMWESCKIEDRDFLEPDKEFDEEMDSKAENESFDQINGSFLSENLESGGSSPTKELSQKKKNPLLRKFGSLLKKKGTSNQK
ncbi:WEB family protein, chloroplastic [Heracleum sosnowskyi]|uniref:WEB family protein, chloroplastic n=1 Tax=Heracleum sosnowskyi TaxID=360622 RepID=A0AAD8HF55_9APIA|nr:WEB family protein, chloroplastic [Heracleum sosnowskyi]